MAKLTKLALEQINTRLANENEALRKQVADLQLNLEMVAAAHADAEADLVRTQRAAPAIRALSPEAQAIVDAGIRAPRIMPAWQVERAAAMAAAKEMAMRTRMVVKA